MIRIRPGCITEIKARRQGCTEVEVQIEGEGRYRAYNYDDMTGPVGVGDEVVLNTSAVAIGLGTGGAHFIMANMTRPYHEMQDPGHIMKMRYSPAQVKVLAAEEPHSPHAEIINNTTTLGRTPVVVGTLHSMLAPAAAGIKVASQGGAKVVYVMTDGAALPLALSNLVVQLREKGLIDATVTCGHAFGGDYETINIYTALLTAVAVAGAGVVVVAMGPGIVGTGSRYGFTGVEQGEIINAVNILEGCPVAIPRISFADSRARHRGLSHHSSTALGKIALTPCTLVLPELDDPGQANLVQDQVQQAGLAAKHRVVSAAGQPALAELDRLGIRVTSMGRSPADDPAFFLAAGATGIYAASLIKPNT